MHTYEVRPRKDHRRVLLSDALPLGPRSGAASPNAINNAIATPSFAAVHIDAVIRVYDEGGNLVETHEHAGEFQEW